MWIFWYIVGLFCLLALVAMLGYICGSNMAKNDIHYNMRACDHSFDLDDNGVGLCRKCGFTQIVH